MSSQAVDLFGIPIDVLGLENALAAIANLCSGYVVTVNPETYRYFRSDARFREAVRSADLRLCDSVGVQAGLRLVSGCKVPRVPGADLVVSLLRKDPGPYYLLGARRESVRQAAAHIAQLFPSTHVCGYSDGYSILDPSTRARVEQKIIEAAPRFLLVGLGIPRQEIWMYERRDLFRTTVSIGVGGTLDVLADATRRAPLWFRAAGLEWAWRIGTQPSRIPRFVRSHIPFVAHLASASISAVRSGHNGNPA